MHLRKIALLTMNAMVLLLLYMNNLDSELLWKSKKPHHAQVVCHKFIIIFYIESSNMLFTALNQIVTYKTHYLDVYFHSLIVL